VTALDARHRYPWTRDDDRFLATAKAAHLRHKVIAKILDRSPRSIDERIYKLKQCGRLALLADEESAAALSEHDRYEADTLRKVLKEASR
jgi:hypothetical protein